MAITQYHHCFLYRMNGNYTIPPLFRIQNECQLHNTTIVSCTGLMAITQYHHCFLYRMSGNYTIQPLFLIQNIWQLHNTTIVSYISHFLQKPFDMSEYSSATTFLFILLHFKPVISITIRIPLCQKPKFDFVIVFKPSICSIIHSLPMLQDILIIMNFS